jgi:DNA modification methylase
VDSRSAPNDFDLALVPAAPRSRASNGDANKLTPEDRAAHDWYRFVLSFPPHLVRDTIQRFSLTGKQRVLDPFCGTGTTIVECKKLGIPSVGIETNPMAHFASRVKADWSPDPDGLVAHACEVSEHAAELLESAGIQDDPILCLESRAVYPLRTLTPEREALLLTDSISPQPLHKTLILLDCLEAQHHPQYHAHEQLALAKALVFQISNLHFGPEVGVGPAKSDAPVVALWLAAVQAMADDLRKLRRIEAALCEVVHADARQITQVLEPESIDAVITSPPYPNEKDYTRTTRLESILLGFIHNKAELQALKRGMVRSNTRGVYKGDDDDRWVAGHAEIQRIAEAIERRRIELGKTSGFERLYARVTRLYFGGMARHLAEMRSVLRPGAQLAYVVGDQASYLRVMIRTGQLMADIAQSLGYALIGIDLFRTRLATATKEQLREEVVLLRWPGKEALN